MLIKIKIQLSKASFTIFNFLSHMLMVRGSRKFGQKSCTHFVNYEKYYEGFCQGNHYPLEMMSYCSLWLTKLRRIILLTQSFWRICLPILLSSTILGISWAISWVLEPSLPLPLVLLLHANSTSNLLAFSFSSKFWPAKCFRLLYGSLTNFRVQSVIWNCFCSIL